LDALAADVDVAGSLDQGADVAVALAAEGTVGVAVTSGIAGRSLATRAGVFGRHAISLVSVGPRQASMGPRSDNRGYDRGAPSLADCVTTASMGPRSDNRGYAGGTASVHVFTGPILRPDPGRGKRFPRGFRRSGSPAGAVRPAEAPGRRRYRLLARL